MAREIIGNLEKFLENFPEVKEDSEKRKALETYFKIGGIVSAEKRGNSIRINYPDYLRLRKQLADIEKQIKLLESKRRFWEKRRFEAKIYDIKNKALMLASPIYWKHLQKCLVDEKYRRDAEAVKLPIEMVAEPKYKAMIEMFVNNEEYRKQLVETVNESIVYKRDKRIAKYAHILQKFRLETAKHNLDNINKKIEYLRNAKKAIEVIMKWLKE